MNYFAHAGEEHQAVTESAGHLLSEPLMALPLFILVLFGIYYGLKFAGAGFNTIALIELVVLFGAGVLLYNLVPAVAIFAICVGITGTLLLSLISLSKG